jgi:glucokinase
MKPYADDARVVMTLDAGGTSFRFSAVRGNRTVTDVIVTPSNADDLQRSLANIVRGFERTRDACPEPPVAISFAFPGPADYAGGIIGDLPNLPGFRGGVALGPMLEDAFGVPVFIANDGNLFTFGESIAGLLPYVNDLLEQYGSTKRFANLVGVTLGTGFGGGIVCDGRLVVGDNSSAGEVWLLRNRLDPDTNAEEGACIRAVRRVYAERAGISVDLAPDPKSIFEIGTGARPGDRQAAREAFRRLGRVAGDALSEATTLIDGLIVVGGGISGSWPLFLRPLVDEMNDTYANPSGGARFRRLAQAVFDLEDPDQRAAFLEGATREVVVPGGTRRVRYDAMPRTGVGISRLGTSEAIAIGGYALALATLDRREADLSAPRRP